MSESYISDNHHYAHSNTNYSGLTELNNTNKLILEWLLGIFGSIIGIHLLVFIIYFKEAIKQFCCRRVIRKSGKMVILGELNTSITEKKALMSNEETNAGGGVEE
jgi:hypothetical protein